MVSSFLGFFGGQARTVRAGVPQGGATHPQRQTLLEEWKYLLRVDLDCSDQGAVISVFIFHTTVLGEWSPGTQGAE